MSRLQLSTAKLNKRSIVPITRLGKWGRLILFSLLCTVLIQFIIMTPDAVSGSTIAFTQKSSSVLEDAHTITIPVNLNTTADEVVKVDYAISGGTANQKNVGSGQDYSLQRGTLTFEPGAVRQNITLTIYDDKLSEANETIEIELFDSEHAELGENPSHIVSIIDDDRRSILDVMRDFNARGDGMTDDTAAIQQAIDTIDQQGGGTLIFPPGVYSVTSVELKQGITYQGYGATIKRPEHQDKWTRTFTTYYSGATNSAPLIVKGLTFDGNSYNQGKYRNYELEQAHLLFFNANPALPGRLQAFVEDCTFENAVSDGISVYTNVDVKVYRSEAIDVFRGGFVLTGGNSSAEVDGLTTSGSTSDTGIDIEVDGRGYGDRLTVNVELRNLNLVNGDFDIAVSEGSTVTGDNITADAPFYLYNLNSTMQFTNSSFKVGAADSYINRIVFPGNLTFENCQFYVTRKRTEEPYQFFSVSDVWWQHSSQDTQRNQLLVFENCSFEVDETIQNKDKTYAIYLREDAATNGNQLILQHSQVSRDFDAAIMSETAGILRRNVLNPVDATIQADLVQMPTN